MPQLHQVVLDTTDARGLAEFYRRVLGLTYRAGDEPPPPGEPDPRGADWLVLQAPGGGAGLSFQQVAALPRATWPEGPVPQQLHLDCTCATREEMDAAKDLAVELGAEVLLDRTDDPDEPLWVLADPAGHPFCVFVGGQG